MVEKRICQLEEIEGCHFKFQIKINSDNPKRLNNKKAKMPS